MTEFAFSKISSLAWDQKNTIRNVRRNKYLSRYIIESHIIILICTLIYGAVLGYYVRGTQIILNSLKIPILYLVTLYIAIPIIFIVDALMENKITFMQVTTLLLLGFTSTSIVLIAFTPLMLFFILTTNDYSFIVILNIAVSGFAGYFGIVSILSSFKRFHNKDTWSPSLIIGSFIIVFVGTQLAWALRPFFHSSTNFTRPISGNFYVALARLAGQNPMVAVIIIGIFLLIAIFITATRLHLDSQDAKKRHRKIESKTKSKPGQIRKENKNINHNMPNYPPPYYPGAVWNIPQVNPVQPNKK